MNKERKRRGKRMGNVKKSFIVHSEMVKAGHYIENNSFIDQINLMVDPGQVRNFEFMVELCDLGDNKRAMKLGVFSDAFEAFKRCPEVFDILGHFASESNHDDTETWPSLIEALERAGWTHKKAKPVKRTMPCPTCGKH